MLNIKTLSILAIAGSATALPQWNGWSATGKYFSGDRGDGNDAAATAIEIVTAYTTVTYNGNYNGNYGNRKHSSATVSTAPASTAPVFTAAASSAVAFTPAPVAPTPTPTPVASSSAPSVAASSSAPAATASGSSDTGYMSIVNKWRAKMSMSLLTESDTLQNNALKTVQDGNGQMVHELNKGSFAQVLAPGSADEFEKVFVGGWLCEMPNLPGLDGICATMSQGWAYDGQTGHAEILSSTAYSQIGCALADGIWGCDLA